MDGIEYLGISLLKAKEYKYYKDSGTRDECEKEKISANSYFKMTDVLYTKFLCVKEVTQDSAGYWHYLNIVNIVYI